MNIDLLLPKGAILRRVVAGFVAHCRTHVTDAALPARYIGDKT